MTKPRRGFVILAYRVFSLTWPASMQIYWNRRKRLHKKRVQLPQVWFGTPTRPPFHCFGTQIWPPWRHVKTHNYSSWRFKLAFKAESLSKMFTFWTTQLISAILIHWIASYSVDNVTRLEQPGPVHWKQLGLPSTHATTWIKGGNEIGALVEGKTSYYWASKNDSVFKSVWRSISNVLYRLDSRMQVRF